MRFNKCIALWASVLGLASPAQWTQAADAQDMKQRMDTLGSRIKLLACFYPYAVLLVATDPPHCVL